jgi:hypothetical protein
MTDKWASIAVAGTPFLVRRVRSQLASSAGMLVPRLQECPMATRPPPLLAIRHFQRPCVGQWAWSGQDVWVSSL